MSEEETARAGGCESSPRTWKRSLRSLLERAAPRAIGTLQAVRGRRLIRRLNHQWGLDRLARTFVAAHGTRVLGGPFAGMDLPYSPNFAAAIPLYLGSHESELAGVWGLILGTPYDRVINVGCAEGFYAVGCARAMPSARVYAFDIDPWARRFTRRLASLNGVEARVQVSGWCDPRRLDRTTGGRCLVFCDCEGYEDVLLDPLACPSLATCDVLVETHEFASPGLRDRLQQRFGSTHTMSWATPRERHAENFPALHCLSAADRARAVAEVRHLPSDWGWFRAGMP